MEACINMENPTDEETGQGLPPGDQGMMDMALGDIGMVGTNLSTKAENHPEEDRVQEEERNLDVISHGYQTRPLSSPGALGASVRL